MKKYWQMWHVAVVQAGGEKLNINMCPDTDSQNSRDVALPNFNSFPYKLQPSYARGIYRNWHASH